VGAILEFPNGCLASFICSFGAADNAEYQIVGTKGTLRLKNGYEYTMPIELSLTVAGKTETRVFPKRDQFAPELLYFSDCVQKNKEPETSGEEGRNDVRIIQAIFKSAKARTAIPLKSPGNKRRPTNRQQIYRAPVQEPGLVHAKAGSQD
jgi:predicted dehydrogenase